MRLFVGIDLPAEIRERLAAFAAQHSPAARGYKWVAPANMHLTVKFIGEAEPAPIGNALAAVPFSAPIGIAISGVANFPNVLFAKVSAPASLAELAGAIEYSLVPLGIAAEKRDFKPHLTLARRKEGGRLPPGLGANEIFGQFSADTFILYQSVLGPRGSAYTALR